MDHSMYVIVHNALATNLALTVRKVKEDPVCSICGKEDESINHMFFRCDHACKVWTLSPFRFRPEELSDFRGVLDWWVCIRDRMSEGLLPSTALGLGLSFCWWIWRTRNEFLFNNVLWATDVVTSKAISFHEFGHANIGKTRVADGVVYEQPLVWSRAEGNLLKINVDAGFSKELNRCGTGALVRDCAGMVMGIAVECYPSISCPKIGEALALRDGLKLGIRLKLSRVIIESDSEVVIKACNSAKDLPSDIGVIVSDCLHLKNSFAFCEFVSVKRHCNRAAHECARKALSRGTSGLWTTPLPLWGSSLSDV